MQPQPQPQQHHTICALTRVKDQPRTLAEWLEYHHVLGIGHTFIVDDCLADDGRTWRVLEAYAKDGLVSLYTPDDVAREGCARWEREHQAGSWLGWLLRMGRGDRALEEWRAAACTYACGAEHVPNEGRIFSFLFAQATAPGARHRCDWLVVFDVDEVMTIQTDLHPSGDLVSLFNNTEGGMFPIRRLPWVTMGSGGLEHRPAGLMVDNFQAGSFSPYFVKTVARPAFVQDWDFSHWPVKADVSASDGFRIPRPYNSLREYAERNNIGPEEIRKVTVSIAAEEEGDGNDRGNRDEDRYDCPAPASPLFLKHYTYRSFDEWTAHRAGRIVKSDGNLNTDIMHPRPRWLKGGDRDVFDDQPCARAYANDFTAAMAERTRASLAARRVRWEAEGAAFPPIEE